MVYGKIIDGKVKYPPVNKRTPECVIYNFYIRNDLLEDAGYKPVKYAYSTEITERIVEDKGDYILVIEPEVSI